MAFERRKTKNRPPISGPLRRLAGQSVREELHKILNEDVGAYIAVGLAFLLLAGWEWFRWWAHSPPQPVVVSIIALILVTWCTIRIVKARTDIRNLKQAEKGERRVSELLTQLRRKRYVAFDDLVGIGSNIDHVLVGPGGIFAIETKSYSVFGNECVGVDQAGVLRLSNKLAAGDPLRQATAAAERVARILNDRLRTAFDVTPVLIFPGWTLKGAKSETGVVVLNDGTILDFFESQPKILSDAQITHICAHLDQAARS